MLIATRIFAAFARCFDGFMILGLRKRRARGWTILGFAGAFALLLDSSNAFACGGGEDCDDQQCSSFFYPEIIGDASCAPFFRSERTFYQQEQMRTNAVASAIDQANTKEWLQFLGGAGTALSDDQVKQLVYKTTLAELDSLIFALKGVLQGRISKPELQRMQKALESLPKRALVIEALYYLGFAKRVEPMAVAAEKRDPWGEEAEDSEKNVPELLKTQAEAQKLITAATKQMKSVQEPFLLERYHLQIMRLNFFSKWFQEATAYFEENRKHIKSNSSVRYRFWDLGAGAYYHLKQYGKANFIFSLLFDQYPPLKTRAYRSFHPQEEADWQQSLSLAQTPREKAVLWQLLGIYADGKTAIEKIRAIDPKSDLLPLLLVREVNKFEETWIAPDKGVYEKKKTVSGNFNLDWVCRIADAGDTSKPGLWNLAAGHLHALVGNTDLANHYLTRAAKILEKSEKPDSLPRRQLRLSQLLAKISAFKIGDSKAEVALVRELLWNQGLAKAEKPEPDNNRAKTLLGWSLRRLSQAYSEKGDWLRSLMFADRPSDPVYLENSKLDAVLKLVKSKGTTELDRFLVENYPYSEKDLLELKGINELYSGNFNEAAKLFAVAEAGSKSVKMLQADPFLIHMNDCHDCDFKALKQKLYSRASFAKKLAELSQKATAVASEEAAQASFDLANGLYNMSYFGNGRDIYATRYANFVGPKGRSYRMDQAERYYKQAMTLSKNREFQAKACFMAAKAEHNSRYSEKVDPWGYFKSPTPFSAGPYFKLLADQYSDTQYYREVLAECGYFRTYENKRRLGR